LKKIKKTTEENNFYKLKNWQKKLKEKNYFLEIRAEKVRSKIDQQQNGQCQKGPQQNGPRQSGRAKKTCFCILMRKSSNCNFDLPMKIAIVHMRTFDKFGQLVKMFLYERTIQVSKIFSVYLYDFTATLKIANFGKKVTEFQSQYFTLFLSDVHETNLCISDLADAEFILVLRNLYFDENSSNCTFDHKIKNAIE